MTAELYFEDVLIGDAMPELVKPSIIKLQHVLYAGASGDFNPLHTDDDFARAVGMKDGVISHGMLIMAFVGQAITNWVPRKTLRDFSVRFSGITRPGNTITVKGSVREKKQEAGENLIICDVIALDEAGDVKITGRFTAALPLKQG
ncbi:dehydratase [bacterium]|nr:dehydratase [bacterium]